MYTVQVLALLLATSAALNIALAVGILARQAGATTSRAILTAAGAASTAMALYFTAVSAYH